MFGTLATYVCNTGYGLNGGNMISVCSGEELNPNGTWSGIPPSCKGEVNLHHF